ncbi:tyrosine--tRNA ligase [Candidatus Woesearchaeota archaeon]|nr:tyrosine--tRNA ligase [Candidatus Woesearchaeota archaeon]
MDIEERLNLIKRNTQEIITEDELRQLLKEKKHPKAYIGLATTGKIHIGYFIPMIKVGDFLKADFKFTILLADIHAHLDDQKTPFDLLDKRVKYYKEIISAMVSSLGIDAKNLEFKKGSDFELGKEYTLDMYRLAALNTFDRCKRAAAGVVRFGENPKLSGFIYPILQALDEQYMDMDVQYGGIDQRKILAFARENLPRLGYKARVEVMTPMLPGLHGTKMSASDEYSKIDLLDSEETIKKKIQKAHCPISTEENGILAFLKYVIMVNKRDNKEKLIVKRAEKFGGNLVYDDYEKLEKDYLSQKLHPMDLKAAVSEEVNKLLEPIRKKMKGKEDLIEKAFPPAR